MYLYHRCVGGESTCTSLDHLVQNATLEFLHVLTLGIVGNILLALGLVLTELLLGLVLLVVGHQLLCQLTSLLHSHQTLSTCCTADETSHEVLLGDGLG